MDFKDIINTMDVKNNKKGYDLKIFCDLLMFYGVNSEINKQELDYIIENYTNEEINIIIENKRFYLKF